MAQSEYTYRGLVHLPGRARAWAVVHPGLVLLILFLAFGVYAYSSWSDQQHRAYVAKRRGDCYRIYVQERERWNNADHPEYDARRDVCKVRYSSPESPVYGFAREF